jgi:hypothetical protein
MAFDRPGQLLVGGHIDGTVTVWSTAAVAAATL